MRCFVAKDHLRFILLNIVFLCLFLSANAQITLNGQISLVINQPEIAIDSLPILPSSVSIDGFIAGTDYRFSNSRLKWLSEYPKDTVIVNYKYLYFSSIYRNKNPNIIQEVYQENPFAYTPPNTVLNLGGGQLNTAGNISRGLGFGNTQDIVVNSNLNLRLNGTLANDVEVLAVISDEDNPIQPEGNTQQIQDFDRVYITLKKDSGTLTVGDFLMAKNEQSYFLNFYKKSRGLQFENVTRVKDWRIQQNAEVAISRGRFSRNTIEGLEGNSGPYRLSGSNGEIFIVIIAATEKVFLDGKLLTRGEDNDYVINYNTGEVTFTPKILITRYSRIVVEFQYSDRNYARSVARAGSQLTKGKSTIYFNVFNEMDLRSQPFQQSLTSYDSLLDLSAIDILAQAGDSTASISNVRQQVAYNAERIMYKKVSVGPIEYFEYAPNPEESTIFYDVSFSNVGFGNGRYIQSQSAANGKVFEYVGPNLGDYEPVELLVAPQRLNVFNIGFVRKDSVKTSGIEFVLSGLDENTISNLDDEDNIGYGFKAFNRTAKYLKNDSSGWMFKSDANYELVSNKFNYLERYRDVEFDRNWNKIISNPTSLLNALPSFEHIGNLNFELRKDPTKYIANNTSAFFRPGNFNGLSNTSDAAYSWKDWFLNARFQLLNSDNSADSNAVNNAYIGYSTSLERRFEKLRIGGSYSAESSDFAVNDSLIGQSFKYNEIKAFLRSVDDKKFSYGLEMGQRIDDQAREGSYSGATLGRNVSLNTQFKDAKSNRVKFFATYRNLEILDTALSTNAEENTLQSRVELNYNLFKKFIRSKTFYQVGTGQEQRREFQYLQIQSGNGLYIWNDYDSNGVKTLNEFEIASDLDRGRADYIKIFTPVAGFFTTNSNKFSQSFEITPAVFFKMSAKKKPFLSRFNAIASVIAENKVLPNGISNLLNPFSNNVSDTLLMNSKRNLRTSVFYNRSNPVYGLDYTFLDNVSKVLLTNGFDTRESEEHRLNTRFNLNRKFALFTTLTTGNRAYTSQFFTDRSFNYNFNSINPKLQYLYNNSLRVELNFKYSNAINKAAFGGETAENYEAGLDFKLSRLQKGVIQTGASYVNVSYNGDPSTTLGYELLQGLQDGNNATWKLSYQRTVAKNIQFIMSYDGRKSKDIDAIHIGRVVARYLF